MIRVAFYLVLVGLAALGIAWFADRPGEVAVTWQGLRIETSLMVALVALVAIVALSLLLWSIIRGIFRSPRQFSEFWRRRRSGQGHLAITKGLLAVGAGDAGLARKYANEAQRLASSEPLALLLGAQAAQLSGDRVDAERAFRKMTEFEDTRLLGLRGLYIEAQRRDDAAGAHLYAEEATRLAPSLPWAGQAVLQFRCAAGDWTGALELVERNRQSGAIDKDTYRRQRAVLLTAQAMAAEESDRDVAKAAVLEAAKLAPDLVPAVALAARFLSEAGDIRKASRMIEKAWVEQPHPDLADAYIHVRLGDSARERLARARRLNEKSIPNIEGAIALGRAAIDAREFVQAREALFPYLDQPTQRVAVLMANLEQAEFGDEGRAREWTARALRAARDPVWTAEGFVSERWLPISPVNGRIDAFEWKVPLAQIAQASADLDLATEAPLLVEEKPEAPSVSAETVPAPQPSPPIAAVAPAPPPMRQVRVRADDIVLPTAPVPDDPGPDPDLEREPAPEPTGAAFGWRRFFSW
jgi:HemY protein